MQFVVSRPTIKVIGVQGFDKKNYLATIIHFIYFTSVPL